MDVLIITVFISLILVVFAVLFLVKRTRAGDFEHGDRLSLLPLEDDARPEPPSPAGGAPGAHGAQEESAGAGMPPAGAPSETGPSTVTTRNDRIDPNRSPSESP